VGRCAAAPNIAPVPIASWHDGHPAIGHLRGHGASSAAVGGIVQNARRDFPRVTPNDTLLRDLAFGCASATGS